LWAPRLEGARVALVAPLLLFPSLAPRATLAAAGTLLALAVAGRARGGAQWVRSAIDPPLVLLLVMTGVAVAVSPLPEVSHPKLTGIVLGVLVYRAILLGVETEADVSRAALAYLAAVLALLAPGLLATGWIEKFSAVFEVAGRLPRLIDHVPGTSPEGVHPNAIAANTLFLLPGVVVVLAGAARDGRRALLAILTPVAVVLSAVLVLSQSRAAWVAFALTGVVVACVGSRRARWATAVAACVLALVVVVYHEAIAGRLLGEDAMPDARSSSATVSLQGRLEVWARALFAIEDFPLTGTGLNTFRRLVHVFYPLFLTSPDFDIAHAHNVFLQTALDVGVPGLIAYLAMLMLATVMAAQVWYGLPGRRAGTRPPVPARRLALALWANLLAVHCWGMADAVVLGAKIGVFVWFTIGLIVALHRVTAGVSAPRGSPPAGAPDGEA
jgi:putative inorganic carbon (HCO3(-)) transporter